MTNAPRFTLDSLREPNTIPYIGLAAPDFWAIVAPAGGGLTLTALFKLGLPGLLLTTLAALCGGLAVYAAPRHLTVTQWFETVRYYLTQPTVVTAADSTSSVNRQDELRADSGTESVLEAAISTDETTREFTNVARVHPGQAALERTDGHLVGALKLEPPNMDFATPDEWARVTESITTWVNQSGDFDLQLYVTTRSFPIEAHIETLEERLTDSDVQENPAFKRVLEQTIAERPQQLATAGTELPHFYLIVTVSQNDIHEPSSGDRTALQKLSELPYLGIPFEALASYRDDFTARQRQARLGSALAERLQRLESDLIQDIDGCESRRVSVVEWIGLLQHFWEGRAPETQQYRRQAAVGRTQRDTESAGVATDGGETDV